MVIILLNAKNSYGPKYQLLISKKSVGLKYLNDSTAFTQIIWIMFVKNIEEHNANKKREILLVFDDIIADVLSNKQSNQTVTELFLLFLSQSLFAIPKNLTGEEILPFD